MKSKGLLVMALSLAMITGSYGLVLAHGPGSAMGSGGMGQGQMGGSGWGRMGSGQMGSGSPMMGGSWGQMGEAVRNLFDSGMSGNGSVDPWRNEHPVTRGEARRVVEFRLGDNPYVRIGGSTDTGDGFEFDIVTRKSQDLVDRVVVEKETGRVHSLN